MDFALVEKNDKGEVLFNKTVEFYGGRSFPEFQGGSYFTEDKREIRLLMAHPWRGKDFDLDPDFPENKNLFLEEVEEPEEEVEDVEPEKVIDPENEEPEEGLEEIEDNEEGHEDGTPIIVPEPKTVQEAALFLRQKDSSIKAVDVRTKAAIAEHGARLGFSFPNV